MSIIICFEELKMCYLSIFILNYYKSSKSGLNHVIFEE